MNENLVHPTSSISITTYMKDLDELDGILLSAKENLVKFYPLDVAINFDCNYLRLEALKKSRDVLDSMSAIPKEVFNNLPLHDNFNNRTRFVVLIEITGHYGWFAIGWELLDSEGKPMLKSDKKIVIAKWQILP